MTGPHRPVVLVALVALAVTIALVPGRAHKPITSPYTYNEDVFPVLRDHCSACHVPGGVAPMSLMTHEDTVPWGESIRLELLAGHMPPWSVDTAPGRFRNVPAMTAREMNVLLTWATGGTPLGNPDKHPTPPAARPAWALGPPDLRLPFPDEFVLPADKQQDTVEFTVSTGLSERRWVRAVDLLPGTPAIVRAATIRVKSSSELPPAAIADETVLALWLPGDEVVPLDDGVAFELPARAELAVRVHYRKTWQYERQEMRDRSTIGLYFTPGPSVPVRAMVLEPSESGATPTSGPLSIRALDENIRAVAIYSGEELGDSGVTVTAVGPDGSRKNLIAFHPRPGWARRYWFREPVALDRGTRIEAVVTSSSHVAIPLPTPDIPRPERQNASTVRLTLNLIPAR